MFTSSWCFGGLFNSFHYYCYEISSNCYSCRMFINFFLLPIIFCLVWLVGFNSFDYYSYYNYHCNHWNHCRCSWIASCYYWNRDKCGGYHRCSDSFYFYSKYFSKILFLKFLSILLDSHSHFFI